MGASTRDLLTRAALLAAAVAACPAARADGWSLQLEPSFNATTTDTTGADGSTTRVDQTRFGQIYRLSLGKTLLPLVHLAAGGTYDWTLASTVVDDVESESDGRRWNGYARLNVGQQVLNGSASYTRRGTELSSRTSGQPRLEAPALVGETYSATLGWRPGGGPTLDLLWSRSENRDEDRLLADRVSDQVLLAATYREIEHLDLRGSVQYLHPVDRLQGTASRELSQTGSVLWSDSFLGRRVSASAGYSISHRDVETTASRPDAVVLTQQLPFEGLSLVEATTDVPTRVTLLANRALIDGDLAASAGLDVGYGVRLGGDARRRDAGVRFADRQTPVNVVHVHVDRPLPPEVWGAFGWTAYASDDNVTWTEVAVDAGGVSFGLFENRFEIPIARVEAQYLKVVTTPLLPGVTIDPALSSIFVTELRVYLGVPAAEVVGRQEETSGALSASVKAVLQRSYNLAYDGGLFVRHGRQRGWNVLNGLSASRRMGRFSAWSARLDRTDSDDGLGHTAQTRASASISADPLPTLGGGLGASAQLVESTAGTGWSVSSSALARADLYTGVSVGANAGAGVGVNDLDQRTRFATVSTTATVVPHRAATLTGAYFLSASRADGAGVTGEWERRWRAEGSLLLNPFPALSMTAGIARSQEGARPATLAAFSLNASPFQGGDLVLRFAYNETIDTGADVRTRQWGPGLRLNIRRGSHLDAAYTVQTSSSGAADTETSAFFANLVITVR